MTEAVGEKALEIAQYPNTITLYPVIDGKPEHRTYVKLAEEALSRLKIPFYEDVYLVTGLPYEISKKERERIKSLLKDELHSTEVTVYPQAVGTLFESGLQSASVINIGHGTTEIIFVEKLNVLSGMSEPLASDYIITALSNFVQTRYGFKPTMDSLVALLSGKKDSITAFGKPSVVRENIENELQSTTVSLVEKLTYDARYILAQLPPNLECANTIILSGGGSLIKGIPEALKQQLGCNLSVPSDPIFSNASGFLKIGRKLYA